MASQENQETSSNLTPEESNHAKTPEKPTTLQEPKPENINIEASDEEDVDLSGIKIVSSISDQTSALNELGISEGYENTVRLCNSATEDIKKSINNILSSRDDVDPSEDNTTAQLQESLNKKMQDFNEVVKGCSSEDDDSNETSDFRPGAVVSIVEENDETEAEKCLEDISDSNLSKVVDLSPKNESNINVKDKSLNASSNDHNQNVSTPVSTPVNEGGKSSPGSKVKEEDSSSFVSKSQVQAPLEPRISDQDFLKNIISQNEEKLTKRQKNGASKKKGEKTIDQILKSLGNGTAEEKLMLLCKKHAETLEESRIFEPKLKQYERHIIAQQREKESTQAELNRMILAKSRLEGLCREMQKQNKSMKETHLLRIKEEEEKRKEISNKFQTTLNEIGVLMEENSNKNATLRKENADLCSKLKGLVDNYEVWEENMQKVVQQKELEAQLAKAKHAKVNLVLKQETEKFLKEKHSLLENLSEVQKRCSTLTSNELQLRTELMEYTSKYEEFQSVLTNSSKVFSTFKTDMETTSKKIKKLEKETNVYKQRWESSNKALLDMISINEKLKKDDTSAQQKIQCLEKLCRALQAERNELQNQIDRISLNSSSTTNSELPLLSEAETA